MYLGTVGHYSDESLSEQLYQDDLVTRWFACFLQGRRNGILRERSVTVGYSSLPVDKGGNFTWNHLSVSEWPPAEARPLRLYFGPDSLLSFAVPTWRMDSLLLRNSMEQPTYTFDTASVEGFRGPRFAAALPRRTIAFMSRPLALPLLWVGVPRMSIFVRSNAIKFPLHVQIYEVDPLGEKYFVNRINWTARHWDAGSAGIVEGRGIAHAHCFRGGSRIRVVVTNLDVTNGSVLGSYPFVLPLFSSADVTIYHGAEHPSYIELPIAAGCVPDEGQRASTR
jgi:predicted acyl esterase